MPKRAAAENGPCLISPFQYELPSFGNNPQNTIDEAVEIGVLEKRDAVSPADGAGFDMLLFGSEDVLHLAGFP